MFVELLLVCYHLIYLVLVASTNAAAADAAKKRKRVDIDTKHSEEPQLKKAFVDTGGIDIKMIGESILELPETNAPDESIKSYDYDEYQPITGTQLNSAGQITITIENQDKFLHLHNSYLLVEGELWRKLIIIGMQMLISLHSPIMDCCIYFPV